MRSTVSLSSGQSVRADSKKCRRLLSTPKQQPDQIRSDSDLAGMASRQRGSSRTGTLDLIIEAFGDNPTWYSKDLAYLGCDNRAHSILAADMLNRRGRSIYASMGISCATRAWLGGGELNFWCTQTGSLFLSSSTSQGVL